ncbi:S1C family serine protease [Deferrisoma sp.]
MKNRAVSAVMVLGLLVCSRALCWGQTAVLLVGDKALEVPAQQALGGALAFLADGPEADYRARVFRTAEGGRLAFDEVFGKNGPTAAARKRLYDEYGPRYVALAWLEDLGIEEVPAYGLKRQKTGLVVRVVAADSGRVVFEDRVEHTSDFRPDGAGAEREGLCSALAARVDTAGLSEAVRRVEGRPGRVKVVFEGFAKKDYFAQRDLILDKVARPAGMTGDLRDSYDEAAQALTVRGYAAAPPDVFYRDLYRAAADSGLFQAFDVVREGASGFVVRRLPPETRMLVVTGLTADRYHDRLVAYREAVEAQPGVSGVRFRYQPAEGGGDDRLVITFVYDGDLAELEEKIWHTLEAGGRVPTRTLESITDRVITYRSGYKAGDSVRLTVEFHNISPGVFRELGPPLESIVKSVGGKNLTKSYDRDLYTLSYRFDTDRPPAEIDAALWQAIERDPRLGQIVPDTIRDQTIAYFYLQEAPDTRHVTLEVKNLDPADYARVAGRFHSVVAALEGVSELRKAYAESTRTLTLEFEYAGGSVYAIDDAVWKAAKGDPDLAKLAMGTLTEGRLEYFFAGPEGAGDEVAVVMKNTSGQRYKVMATRFSGLLGRIEGVREVRSAYDFRTRTAVFRLAYGGELTALEEALQRAMAADDFFRYVAQGPTYPNRIVLYYHEGELGGGVPDAPPADEGAALPSGGGRAALVEALDPGVVVVMTYTGAGPTHATGFFVTPDGYLLTSAAAVKAGQVVVQTHDGQRYRAQVIKTDPELDLALVKVSAPGRTFPPADLGDSKGVRKGAAVFLIGTPVSEAYEHTVVAGVVSGLERHRGLFQLSMDRYAGYAGAPVYDEAGRVVGVVTDAGRAPGSPDGFTLAVPVNFARPLVDMAR